MIKKDIIILGGGASAFFLASNLNNVDSNKNILILEQAKSVLQKVKISGGGRCNVTNACFEPSELINFYPRGKKQLLSVFTRFNPKNTINWFDENGVKLKIEQDNRVFPESNSSQTIIDLLIKKTLENNIEIKTLQTVLSIKKNDDNSFKIRTQNIDYQSNILIICSGSSPKIWQVINQLGHKIIPPVPSLFSFNIKDKLLDNLPGISFENSQIKVLGTKYIENGSILITHWGLSGPAILRLSSWNARFFNEQNYKFKISINFLGKKPSEIETEFNNFKLINSKKNILNQTPFSLTSRFWQRIIEINNIPKTKNYADLNKKEHNLILEILTNSIFDINGKNTFKDEFVTAGGIDLNEINFKTMESKLIPNLYFTGEVLDIDAITGGFNFQACWSQAFIISEELNKIRNKIH